jgi:23S rRNA pseudouridine1911/1915/1917 synthase
MMLQDVLRQRYPQARQNTLRQMLADGRVLMNGNVVRRMNQPVGESDRIDVRDRQKHPAVAPRISLAPLEPLFEDEHLLVIHKPAGVLTSTTPREKRPTALAMVTRYLESNDPRARVGLIHRLDRDASGLLVFSKNEPAYESLKRQFFEHTVRREYVAITRAVPTPLEGRIESSLVEQPDGSVRSTLKLGKGQHAVTEYKTIARAKGQAALWVKLHTGRKHQIRAHLTERGVSIMGDPMYGPRDRAPRLMLANVILEFQHPATGKTLHYEIPIPAQFPLVGGQKLSQMQPAK